jgi:cytochrome c-type biogenesis protein CcmE
MTENRTEIPAKPRRSAKQVKFLAGGAVVILIIAYLIFSSMQGATAAYLTVREVKAAAPSDRLVRVSGTVVGDTIDWDAHNVVLRFELADDTGRLLVVYKGVRPDMLRDGATATAEGKMGPDGTFQATQILLKCPSKYEEKATEQAASR